MKKIKKNFFINSENIHDPRKDPHPFVPKGESPTFNFQLNFYEQEKLIQVDSCIFFLMSLKLVVEGNVQLKY